VLQPNKQDTPQNRFTQLMTANHFGIWFLVVAAAIAAGLGALHALEPGHGKTIVAAYLVGSKGTAYHAFLLGLIVTASHTAGVYALGAVTLYASRYIVPEQLYPWLGAISGMLIAALGSYLFLHRYSSHAIGHSHRLDGHNHHHGPTHSHTHADGYVHSHDGHEHSHAYGHHHHHEISGDVSYRQLLALGITGGIVPCPAALVVLLSAVALNRVGFGLFLIVAFSFGLAAVLIAVGMLMVYARQFMTKFRSEGPLITHWLPLTSAAVITFLGLAIAVRSLVTGGILQIRV
jgi:ABC-type nickel/cobalt efflux system permease component RcnA